ncbi:MAG TPA: calcium-binding protein, partial [Pirellulaceae bacterium]|nr:calcium-binding protein [Pirellulaceae bacterium]
SDTATPDTITGTPLTDLIFGQHGNDWIDAVVGDDCIFGGADNDTLQGNVGNDLMLGGSGDDTVTGAAGLDSLYGGTGNDRIFGGLDNDWMEGNAGNDWLEGGQADDSMYGGSGVDTLFGDGENDTLNGGTGIDELHGGYGTDRFEIVGNEAEFDSLLGDGDLDDLYLVASATTPTLNGFSMAGTLIERVQGNGLGIQGNSGANVITLTGTVVNNLLWVDGLAGNDTLTGSSVADTLYGGANDDVLQGLDGADVLDGGSGADTLYGGNGDDSLNGGIGVDSVMGDGGNDTIQVQDDEAQTDYIRGGINTDKILNIGAGPVTIAQFVALTTQIEQWFGNGQAILGTSAANVFDFRTDPAASTTSSASSVVFSNVSYVDAQGGVDTIYGTNLDDTLYGGTGNDTIYGMAGNDSLNGGDGDDSLSGANGNDRINGDDGVDTMTGGNGSDTFVFIGDATSLDVITDWTTSEFIQFVGYSAVYADLQFAKPNLNLRDSGTGYALPHKKVVKLNGAATIPSTSRVTFS